LRHREIKTYGSALLLKRKFNLNHETKCNYLLRNLDFFFGSSLCIWGRGSGEGFRPSTTSTVSLRQAQGLRQGLPAGPSATRVTRETFDGFLREVKSQGLKIETHLRSFFSLLSVSCRHSSAHQNAKYSGLVPFPFSESFLGDGQGSR
jgi:hypothetical protein